MNKFTKLSLYSAVLAASVASTAQAETANDTVDVYVGLASALTLECSDVNFGTWRVPPGFRTGEDGNTIITLTNSRITISGGRGDQVALSASREPPLSGFCMVKGSVATEGDGNASLTTPGGTFVEGITGPRGFNSETIKKPTARLGGFSYTLELSDTTPVISPLGEASFAINGTMSIPDNVLAENFGGYIAKGKIVTFDDNVTP